LPALELLLEARSQAEQCGVDPWQFAVELPSLLALGASRSALRRLCLDHLVSHAVETTRLDSSTRTFKPVLNLSLPQASCFVLTDAGAGLVARARSGAHARKAPGPSTRSPALLPLWNPARRELSYAGQLVKAFRQPSPNQERILTVFEEEGWPPQIDDPLPPCSGIEPGGRLRDTIKHLNLHQTHPLLLFRGNGLGHGVLWEPAPSLLRASLEVPPTKSHHSDR
jgi:hypothetical protein